MTEQEFQSGLQDLIDYWLMTNDDGLSLCLNSQRDDKWINWQFNLEVEPSNDD